MKTPDKIKMASMEQRESVESWEKMMACCIPCGLVWFKEGTGSSCFVNLLLGCVFGSCCVHVCHACTFVGKPAKEESPCAVIATHGEVPGVQVITHQPKL
ncbi:hypothetical protein Ocin01_06153 [Orchesella cincta]|uniref:Uncharacterized protein n=1 Tax=Orchesella cincta TaxID=48709 RepID=A0A1D2N6D8_ORCCI|nr:hypothetical protein Ocin01_06153 [Orchesella cincta]